VIEWFRDRSDGITVSELETVHEDVSFQLPRPIRRALAMVAVETATKDN